MLKFGKTRKNKSYIIMGKGGHVFIMLASALDVVCLNLIYASTYMLQMIHHVHVGFKLKILFTSLSFEIGT